MIERLNTLETQIEAHSKTRTLNSDEAKSLLDEYYNQILELMCTLNDVTVLDKHCEFKVQPLNFKERLEYINQRKYHYMGFQQMKTMLLEINKLLAVKNIKKKR